MDKTLKKMMLVQLAWMVFFVVPAALAACAIQKSQKKTDPRPVWVQYPGQATKVVEKKVYVNCMDPQPVITPWPEWSAVDRMGNVVISAYMAKQIRDDRYELERYIAAQYSKCHYTAKAVEQEQR
jgi:hypothetical protein